MIEATHPYQPPSSLQEKKALQNLDVQVAQISNRISEVPQETLSSDTTSIPNESCGAITFMNKGIVEYDEIKMSEEEEVEDRKGARKRAKR